MTTKHTPGPWRWEYNAKSKSVNLVGGVPTFDKTVMQFGRWGLNGAVPLFNAEITGNLWNIMERLCDQPDWIAPFEGRKHHADWCSEVVHPDARLIAAAPDLLEALRCVVNDWVAPDGLPFEDGEMPALDSARAAIAKATGSQS